MLNLVANPLHFLVWFPSVLIMFFIPSRQIIHEEGFRALFKGLAPNLVGVAPSRYVFVSVHVVIIRDKHIVCGMRCDLG